MSGKFRTTGVHNRIPLNAIPVIVTRDQVDLSTLVSLDKVDADVGTVGWRDRLSRIKIPNGRHRTRASADYGGFLTVAVAKARTDLESVNAGNAEDAPERIAQLTAFIEQAEKQLEGLGTWLGTFYDDGQSPV